MKTWEEIVCVAKELGAAAVRKGTDVADYAKTKVKIAENERAIEATLEALGKLLYDSRRDEKELDEETVNELVAQVNDLTSSVENLQAGLDSAKGKKACPECGARNPEDAVYCNYCGKEL